ncbi:MAG TPA: DUF4440 domain-containing protein [Bryobacteraceae bacterium]|nr:DUF4440 domain-containing protein [Bryobacteraceae bacterium]
MGKFTVLVFCLGLALAAEDPAEVLGRQAEAWNRGDLLAFVDTYDDSPSITFLGKELTRGRADVLKRYQRDYGTAEKRGNLRFTILEKRTLGTDYMLLLGAYELRRTEAGGGNASGRFTLILRKTGQGWKIIHDHTS